MGKLYPNVLSIIREVTPMKKYIILESNRECVKCLFPFVGVLGTIYRMYEIPPKKKKMYEIMFIIMFHSLSVWLQIIVSKCLVFDANSAIFQLYHGKEQVTFI